MEAIERIETVRGGEGFAINTGYNAVGIPMIWFDILNPDPVKSKGQPVREFPKQIIINFEPDEQGRGVLSSVHSKFNQVLLANNTQILAFTAQPLNMDANVQDKSDFSAMFWPAFRRFIPNGWMRKIKGFNYWPVFLGDGSVNELTPEQQQEPGSGDYDTHRVDGSVINPIAPPDGTL
ncbi:hypothetical protein OB13_10820 [Pontibacter sp. HJ8]